MRDVQPQSRQSLERYMRLQPVIDGVEGTFTKTDGLDPAAVKLIGNVPANGKAPGGRSAAQRLEGGKSRVADAPSREYVSRRPKSRSNNLLRNST